jgi:hypothetical protein
MSMAFGQASNDTCAETGWQIRENNACWRKQNVHPAAATHSQQCDWHKMALGSQQIHAAQPHRIAKKVKYVSVRLNSMQHYPLRNDKKSAREGVLMANDWSTFNRRLTINDTGLRWDNDTPKNVAPGSEAEVVSWQS